MHGINHAKLSFCLRIEYDALSAGRGFENLQMFWQVLCLCAYLRTINDLILMWVTENDELLPDGCFRTIEDCLAGVFETLKALKTTQQPASINQC